MCGRYRLTAKERYLRDHFGLDEHPPWQPRWNIAPTQPIAAVLHALQLLPRAQNTSRDASNGSRLNGAHLDN